MARTSKRKAKCKKPRRKPVRLVYEDDQWVRGSKQIAELREKLIKEQNGIDPITGEPLRKPVLDHNHDFNSGKCRGVLNSSTNLFEGRVRKIFIKYLMGHTDLSLPEVLRNLADYYEKDLKSMPLHGNHVDSYRKHLNRLNLQALRQKAADLKIALEEQDGKNEIIQKILQEFIRNLEEKWEDASQIL